MNLMHVCASRVAAFRVVATALKLENIQCAVVHGTEGLPVSMGRDVDILVERRFYSDAARCASEALIESGWTVIQVLMPWDVTMVIGYQEDDDQVVAFEADFLVRQVWFGCQLVTGVSGPGGLEEVEDYAIGRDLWASFVKRCLIQVLAGNRHKLVKCAHEFVLAERETEVVGASMKKLIGEKLWQEMNRALSASDVESLLSLRKAIQGRILLSSVIRPWVFQRSFRNWLRFKKEIQNTTKQRAPLIRIGFGGRIDERWATEFMSEAKARLVFPACHQYELGGNISFSGVVRKLALVELVILSSENHQFTEEFSSIVGITLCGVQTEGDELIRFKDGWSGSYNESMNEGFRRVMGCFKELHLTD